MKTLFIALILISFNLLADTEIDRCHQRWDNEYKNINKAVKLTNQGINTLYKDPAQAYNYLNEAYELSNPEFSLFYKIYDECNEVTAISKKMADKAVNHLRVINTRSGCGMDFSNVTSSYNTVNEEISDYNALVKQYKNDTTAIKVKIIPAINEILNSLERSLIKTDALINDNNRCESEQDILNSTIKINDLFESHHKFFSGIKKKLTTK